MALNEQRLALAQRSLQSLQEDNERLRKALKPFADFADFFEEGEHGYNPDTKITAITTGLPLTVGDLFEARKALKPNSIWK